MRRTPYFLFFLMRKIFILTGGLSNDLINKIISIFRPFKSVPSAPIQSVLGSLSENKVEQIVTELNSKGFFVFDAQLPTAICDEIVRFSDSLNCRLVGSNSIGSIADNPGLPRYDYLSNDLVRNDQVCNLITDNGLLEIAGRYFEAHPICDLISMWRSYPANKLTSQAAQEFHFDMDRPKFLKFFFYLTDVDDNNGPHCFIEGSHKLLPLSLRRDGRFSDNKILKYYGAEKLRRLKGPKGTILAVDTRGFHKGEPLIAGSRIIFQLEFSNSLFGMYYPPLTKSQISPVARDRFENNPESYLRIFADDSAGMN